MLDFRFVPTTAEVGRLIHRPRLTLALAERFQRRLTTVVGAAGFGKTAALALAVENNLLDPMGRDIWLSATPRDADIEHFASGLARAVDTDNTGGSDEILTRIHDAIWAQAPTDVALVIDDAQFVDNEPGRGFLLRLINELPANAHLVLASRTPLGLPSARLQSHGQLLEVTVSDLELSDDELDSLVTYRRQFSNVDTPNPADGQLLPRHVATADLALAAGHTAGADFLWEEILTHVDPDRLADLQRASVVEVLDEPLTEALTDGRFTLDELIADIPLTERRNKTVRLHALLRDALGARVPKTERSKAQEVAGEFERQRQRWSESVHLFEAAGDPVATYATIRDFCLSTVLARSVEDNIVLDEAIQRIRPDSGVALAVQSSRKWMAQATNAGASASFARTIKQAIEALRAEGEDELEAAQLHLSLQAQFLSEFEVDVHDIERLAELAERSDRARRAHAFNVSALHVRSGRVTEAIDVLDALERDGANDVIQMRNERLADLGRFEDIDWDGEADSVREDDMMGAYARWLRGDVDPALAFLVINELLAPVLRRGFAIVSVSTLGVAVAIAAAAGEDAAARRWSEQASNYLGSGFVPGAEYFARLANAIVAASTGDEDSAAAALDPAATRIAFEGWPARSLLLSIPLIYLVRPDARDMFNRCTFGHALTVAVQAGSALVALRELGETAPAAALPWDEVNLLRANLVPVHLVELGAAAHAAGNQVAGAVVTSTPNLASLSRLVSARSSGPTLNALSEFTHGVELTAPFELATNVLGDPTLQRNGEPVENQQWKRRTKVRELWTYLVVHRHAERYELISNLWPESGTDEESERKALANLRSTLSMLISILEPDREPGADSFFVTTDGSFVELSGAVTSDLDLLQEAADSGQAADASGLPLEALRHHRRVVELYRGPLAAPVDASWLVFERLRIAALAIGSACRVAELYLGRGEPETAAQWAQVARQHDPLSERAGRLFVESLAAIGDRPGARVAADHLRASLDNAGISLEPATRRSFDRLFGR